MATHASGLGRSLTRLCGKFPGRVGVGYKSLENGDSVFLNPDKLFSTASVFKIFVLVDLFRRAAEGKFDLDNTLTLKDTDRSPGSGVLQYVGEGATMKLRQYARLMMIISDNTAADVLFDFLGPESLADTIGWLGLKNTSIKSNCKDILTYGQPTKELRRNLELLGLSSRGLRQQDAMTLLRRNAHRLSGIHTLTELRRFLSSQAEEERQTQKKRIPNDDVTSPRDLVTTFEQVYCERVLGKYTDEFLEIMASCETGQNRIRRGLPQDAILIHKTGTVRGVVNDAGIVLRDSKPYALVVLVSDIPVNVRGGYVAKGEKIISEISGLVWKSRK